MVRSFVYGLSCKPETSCPLGWRLHKAPHPPPLHTRICYAGGRAVTPPPSCKSALNTLMREAGRDEHHDLHQNALGHAKAVTHDKKERGGFFQRPSTH